ncbi:MAG TPA: endonuclease/exonuclease/phosphatase family protein [Solirubrobacteraceae bacterium]
MRLRALTWNLMHGRSQPPAGRDLLDEFSDALARWEWDVALLQEVPPWWPEAMAARLGGGAQHRSVLTSRNELLSVRRALAVRSPDAIKSAGGGANAMLVRRADLRIADHRALLLCRWPERRRLHAVRLVAAERELWVGNLHATVHDDPAARREGEQARVAMGRWAAGAPFVLGGDFNVRGLALAGLATAAHHDVDYIFVAGLEAAGDAQVLDRGALSDHAPVAVTLDVSH